MIAALCRTTAALEEPLPPYTAATAATAVAMAGDDRDPVPPQVSGRKKSALFTLAERFALAAEKAAIEDSSAWAVAAESESRKSLRIVLNALAAGTHPDAVQPALAQAGFAGSADPGDRLESDMLAAGAVEALRGSHPYILMRVMTARLGPEYYEKTTEWILERIKRRKYVENEFFVPGDLPEVLARLEKIPGKLELALRMAGREMSAAALCGCPAESIVAVLAPCGRIGGAILEDSMRAYRAKLSTEEIADAQAAFADLARELDEPKAHTEPVEPEDVPDPGLVEDLTDLILELDPKLLRTVALSMDPKKLASLLQVMAPAGHDRMLTTIGPMRESRVINALDAAQPLGSFELTREAQVFAQKILAAAVPKGKTRGKTIPLPAKVRRLLSSILGRE
ncbi:MAG: hypothetical protein ABFC75_03855 [Rectinema sp.]